MELTIRLNTGANPDPMILQQLLVWAAKADAGAPTLTAFTAGNIGKIEATGVSHLTLGHSATVDSSDTSQAIDTTAATDDQDAAGDETVADSATGAKKRGRKPKGSAEQQSSALTAAPAPATETAFTGALPPGAALPPGMAPPTAQSTDGPAQHPEPTPPVLATAPPAAPPVQVQQPAMPPATGPSAEPSGVPSLEDLRGCLVALTAQRPGMPFRIMGAGAWPSDNTPKARWFTAESVPVELRERLMTEMAQAAGA